MSTTLELPRRHVAVIGAGPAGLMAAEMLSGAGHRVVVADAMPSAGRKLLMAGKSGLNLTKDEPAPAFRAACDPFGRPLPEGLDAALRAPPAIGVQRVAAFAAQADKRATLELALDHLLATAPAGRSHPEAIELPAAGAPFGSLLVDTDKCTMCLSCVGACPQAALADNPDKPQLKFIEKNCVQCGLCASTCPEQAITLQPRLWLADGGRARKAPRVLNEMQPYACVRCARPFGTLRAIEAMVSKLAGHSAFQGAAAERLKMCGDCRVIDIYSNPNETRITDF